MRPFLALSLLTLPGLAQAHPGHLGELAGHDHVLAGVALGLAAAIALWAALKGRKDDETEEVAEAEEDTPTEEPQEA